MFDASREVMRANSPAQAEYDVLSAIIQQRFVDGETRLVVVDSDFGRLKLKLPKRVIEVAQEVFRKIEWSTVEDFRGKFPKTCPVEPLFNLTVPYHIFSREERETMFKFPHKDGWGEFQRTFNGSKGLIFCSRVGFSDDGTEALTVVSCQPRRHKASGDYYHLKNTRGEWTIRARAEAWVYP